MGFFSEIKNPIGWVGIIPISPTALLGNTIKNDWNDSISKLNMNYVANALTESLGRTMYRFGKNRKLRKSIYRSIKKKFYPKISNKQFNKQFPWKKFNKGYKQASKGLKHIGASLAALSLIKDYYDCYKDCEKCEK